jgi:hypothetical protein
MGGDYPGTDLLRGVRRGAPERAWAVDSDGASGRGARDGDSTERPSDGAIKTAMSALTAEITRLRAELAAAEARAYRACAEEAERRANATLATDWIAYDSMAAWCRERAGGATEPGQS